MFEGVDAGAMAKERADELAGLPLFERLARRIVDGEKKGLEADLDEALHTSPALDIVNDDAAGRDEDRRRPVRAR